MLKVSHVAVNPAGFAYFFLWFLGSQYFYYYKEYIRSSIMACQTTKITRDLIVDKYLQGISRDESIKGMGILECWVICVA